jgi:hypothetical protein
MPMSPKAERYVRSDSLETAQRPFGLCIHNRQADNPVPEQGFRCGPDRTTFEPSTSDNHGAIADPTYGRRPSDLSDPNG